jgi:hypothetical protein
MSEIRTVEIETTNHDIQTGDKTYTNNPIALAARRVLSETEGVSQTGFLRMKKRNRYHYPQVIPVPLEAALVPTKFIVAVRNEEVRS